MSTAHPKLQIKVLKAANSNYLPKYVLLDSKGVHIKERFEQLKMLLSETNVFFATEEEMELLFNYEDTRNIGCMFENFCKLKMIIIKCNKKGGRVLLESGVSYHFKATTPGKVVDPMGAGDVFAGTFAGLLSQKGMASVKALKGIIATAAKVAAISVGLKGKNKFTKGKLELYPRPVAKIYVSNWK